MDPQDSAPSVSAVEVAAASAPRSLPTFFHGALAGLSAAAAVAQVWLAVQLAPLRDAYKDMGSAALPFVLKPVWLYSAPIAGMLAAALLIVVRPRALGPYAAVAVASIAAALATWHFAYAPLWELAGNIAD